MQKEIIGSTREVGIRSALLDIAFRHARCKSALMHILNIKEIVENILSTSYYQHIINIKEIVENLKKREPNKAINLQKEAKI